MPACYKLFHPITLPEIGLVAWREVIQVDGEPSSVMN